MGEPFYHHAILQRLGSYLPNASQDVFYSPESFTNAEAWEGVPLIFAEVVDSTITHPDFDAVSNHDLPDNYRVVGQVGWAFLPQDGQPRLEAQLEITDAAVEQIARDGLLGLSTGFSAQIIPDGDSARIVGTVSPNHVLLFQQGACPNCFPNDNGAMFLNVKENETMTEDTEVKSMFQKIMDKLTNTKEAADTTQAQPVADAEKVQLQNTIDALTKELDAIKADAAQREKDAAWANIKNTLPEGWLGAKESETRAEFENSKDAFYQRLMAHKAEFSNTKAEGSVACGCKASTEAQLKNALEENLKKIGFRPHGGI